jgi:hypothetical protein
MDHHDLACVVCMQDFDEYDYDQSRFITERCTGKQYKFESKTEATRILNDIVKREYIAPEYKLANFDHIYK